MLMTRDSFIIYRSFIDAGNTIEKKLARLSYYEAIFNFAIHGTEPELKGVAKGMFSLVKPQLEANQRRYENGAKGGRKPTKEEPKPNQSLTESEANANDNKNVNDNDNVNDFKPDKSGTKKNNFKTWNEDEFKENIRLNKSELTDKECHAFFSYWSELDTKGKMKFQLGRTWETKKRLATWANNNFNQNNNNGTTKSNPATQGQFIDDDNP